MSGAARRVHASSTVNNWRSRQSSTTSFEVRRRDLGCDVDDRPERRRAPDAVNGGDVGLRDVVAVDDDCLVAEPHPLGQEPVAVDAERLERCLIPFIVLVPELILVETTSARQQLAGAHQAALEVAAGVEPAAPPDAAVITPRRARSAAGFCDTVAAATMTEHEFRRQRPSGAASVLPGVLRRGRTRPCSNQPTSPTSSSAMH